MRRGALAFNAPRRFQHQNSRQPGWHPRHIRFTAHGANCSPRSPRNAYPQHTESNRRFPTTSNLPIPRTFPFVVLISSNTFSAAALFPRSQPFEIHASRKSESPTRHPPVSRGPSSMYPGDQYHSTAWNHFRSFLLSAGRDFREPGTLVDIVV
jgi:hypothetical protein